MVALAFQLEDERLLGQVRAFLDWTLDHQGDDGWIGPEVLDGSSDVPRLTWPRYLVLMGFVVSAIRSYSCTILYDVGIAICRSGPFPNRTDRRRYA